jgi:probable HAF family extracellular repeat protein
MRKNLSLPIASVSLFAALALPVASFAQEQKEEKIERHHYKLVDFGTFGGPNSSYALPNPKGLVNNLGVVVGSADTSTPDPTSTMFNGDAYLSYGFKWQDGVFHKLGALPGFNSSIASWISDNGLVVGFSENGIDPLTGGRALEAVLWGKDGSITDLGTLGGNESTANAVNNRGQVVGTALNTIPDPYNYTGNFLTFGATQAHAFRWTKAQGMQDLGTLGGTDSAAVFINDRGQILGFSYTDSTVNPTTGIPTLHPFLWENGKMTDLGTLGGTFAGPFNFESFGALNSRGDVAGTSNLAGDLTNHPFLWTKSEGMKDLGTLGGTFGFATWINDAREVVGLSSNLNDQALHAFFWRDGVMTDLQTVGSDPNSQAYSINSRGQVVGSSFDCCANFGTDLHGFLWEDGGPIVDLNTLVPPGSGVTITSAFDINDRGEIAVGGFNSQGDHRAFLLIPCDEDHPDLEGCDYDPVEAVTEAPVRSAQITTALAAASATKLSPTEMMKRRHHHFGSPQFSPK